MPAPEREAPTRASHQRQKAPALHLTVISGPDAGQTSRFDRGRVRIGRDPENDFALKDRYVSNQHGEFRRVSDGFVYEDLDSRHGSLVLVDDVSVRLHGGEGARPVRLTGDGEIQVGSTVLRVMVELPQHESPMTFARASDFKERAGSDERYIMATQTSLEALSRRFTGKDPRLEILFKLAGTLNSLNRLEAVVDLIVEATFEVFPAANLFSISLLADRALTPFTTRMRAVGEVSPSNVIVSQSILERVVETQEAVLFVRDNLGQDLSRSIIEAKISASLCAPLVGQRSLLGVMQVDSRSHGMMFSQEDLELFSVFASNVAFAVERARLTEDIYRMFEGFVNASVSAIEARDPTTAGHSARVAEYSLALALKANGVESGRFSEFFLTPPEMTELRYAALLHDFGKVGVRESVLVKGKRIGDLQMALIRQRFLTFRHLGWRQLKEASEGSASIADRHDAFCAELDGLLEQLEDIRERQALGDEHLALVAELGRRSIEDVDGSPIPFLTPQEVEHLSIRFGTLSEEEWANMRSHAAQSEAYLRRIPWSEDLKQVPCIAGQHHEKLDGSGYPLGLQASSISDQVRILTVADIFDAVTAWDRPYRKAASVEQAVRILRQESATGKLDADFVGLFVDEVIPEIIRLVPNG